MKNDTEQAANGLRQAPMEYKRKLNHEINYRKIRRAVGYGGFHFRQSGVFSKLTRKHLRLGMRSPWEHKIPGERQWLPECLQAGKKKRHRGRFHPEFCPGQDCRPERLWSWQIHRIAYKHLKSEYVNRGKNRMARSDFVLYCL